MPQSFKLEKPPVTRKELEKGVKEYVRTTDISLLTRVTSDVLKQTYCFLEGYWLSIHKEIQEPYLQTELKSYLIEIASKYTTSKLTAE